MDLKVYYSLWKSIENRFGEPLLYDYTFEVRFPNIVFIASNFDEAKRKIKALNSKMSKMDRYDLSRLKIQRLAVS